MRIILPLNILIRKLRNSGYSERNILLGGVNSFFIGMERKILLKAREESSKTAVNFKKYL
jgi:hypothetical protein